MYGTFFKIVAKAGKVGELIEFLRWDAAVAKAAEPATRRFDVWNVPDEANAVYVYEAYTDQAGFEKHQQNEPFKRYVSYVEPSLLEGYGRADMFGFTESVTSNDDSMWQTDGRIGTPPPGPRRLTKLSITSFPPDVKAMCHFNNYVELRRLTTAQNASVNHVHFPPGGRTDWHLHHGDQLLWFIEGQGEVVLRDRDSGKEERMLCQAGDMVRVPAESSHWHGASLEHATIHVAITTGETVWQERVAEPHHSC